MLKNIFLVLVFSFLCASVGVAALALLVYRQEHLTSIPDVLVSTFVYFFPMFYIVLFIAGVVLVRVEKYSKLKGYIMNSRVLIGAIVLIALVLVIPITGFVSYEILLDILIALCFVLALNVYLQLLSRFAVLAVPAKK